MYSQTSPSPLPKVRLPRWINPLDPDNVQANQRGVLTPQQIMVLEKKGFYPTCGVFLVTFGVVLTLCVLYSLVAVAKQWPSYLPYCLVALLFCVAIFAAAQLFFVRARAAQARFRQQMAAGAYRIETALGEIIWGGDGYLARTRDYLIPHWGGLPRRTLPVLLPEFVSEQVGLELLSPLGTAHSRSYPTAAGAWDVWGARPFW